MRLCLSRRPGRDSCRGGSDEAGATIRSNGNGEGRRLDYGALVQNRRRGRSGRDSANRGRERGPEAMRAEAKVRRSTGLPRAGVAHERWGECALRWRLSAGVGVKTAGRVVRPGERGGEMKSVSKTQAPLAGTRA
jgi:hypothetical protein